MLANSSPPAGSQHCRGGEEEEEEERRRGEGGGAEEWREGGQRTLPSGRTWLNVYCLMHTSCQKYNSFTFYGLFQTSLAFGLVFIVLQN